MDVRLPAMPAPGQPFTLAAASFVMGCQVALLWVLEIIDTVLLGSLDTWGISPRELGELPQVFTAPLLHNSWGHLISNTVPFFLLGTVILLSSLRRWVVSTLASIVGSGLLVWLISPPHTITLGASGLIFGWLVYLLARGFFSREPRQMLLAVVVFVVYGGVLWGVLPTNAFVSWQGHLGGALGGLLAAWFLHTPDERRREQTARIRHLSRRG